MSLVSESGNKQGILEEMQESFKIRKLQKKHTDVYQHVQNSLQLMKNEEI